MVKILIFVVFAVIVIIVFSKYNKLVKLQNKVKQAKSGIDVYLNQRFDLIPNLAECVKGYIKHEKDLLEKIAKMRSEYMQGNKNLKNAEKINGEINKIIAIAEKYPDLNSSEQFLNLQKNL